jgi:hypothetical protein
MATRKCKYERNETTGKCNRKPKPVRSTVKKGKKGRDCKNGRNATTGKCNPKVRDCKNGRNPTTGKCNRKKIVLKKEEKNEILLPSSKKEEKIEVLLPSSKKEEKTEMERQAKYHEDLPDFFKERSFDRKSREKKEEEVEEYLKNHKNKYKFGDIIFLEDGVGDDGLKIVLSDGKYRSCGNDDMDSILCPIILKEEGFEEFIDQGVKYDTVLKELEKDEFWNPLISKYLSLDFYGKELKTYEEIVKLYRENNLLSE